MDVHWSIIEKAMKRHFSIDIKTTAVLILRFVASSRTIDCVVCLSLSVDLVHLFNLVQIWKRTTADIILCVSTTTDVN